MGDTDRLEFERPKLAVDSVKHITTLAAGTIVLIATFADRLPKPPMDRAHIVQAILCMAVCLGVSFVYLWAATLAGFPQKAPVVMPSRLWFYLFSFVIYFSFCYGIYALSRFAISNV